METEVFNLNERKVERAVSFYRRNRIILNKRDLMEEKMFMEGLIDMNRVRRFTKVDTPRGYKYCQNKFLSLCAKHFGVTVTDMKKKINGY